MLFSYPQVVVASFQNPYNTLGVSATSDEKEIKQAYRKAAKQWHPDVSKQPEAETVFLKLTEAYEFLMGKIHGGKFEASGSPQTENWVFHDWLVPRIVFLAIYFNYVAIGIHAYSVGI